MTHARFHKPSHSEVVKEIAGKLMRAHKMDEFIIKSVEQYAEVYRAKLLSSNLYDESQVDKMVKEKISEAFRTVIKTLPDTLLTVFKQAQAEKTNEQQAGLSPK
jgi:primase-polymerase (primpol)-like protein